MAYDNFTIYAVLGVAISYPAKMILGLNYAMEFGAEKDKLIAIVRYIILNAMVILGLPLYYEIHKDWYTI